MREYPDNHRRLFDDGDDLQGTATLRAVFEVDIEHALEQARPAHACRRFMRVVSCIIARFLQRARHDRGAQPRVGRQRAVGERHHCVSDVVAIEAGLADGARLTARPHLDHRIVRHLPAEQIDKVSQRIDHRRRMRIALQHLEYLRARIVDARRQARHAAETPESNLLFDGQVTPFEAAAVTDVQAAAALRGGSNHLVGIFKLQRNRLLDQHMLAELQGLQHRLDVLVLAGRHDHRIDCRIGNNFEAVGTGN